LIDAQIGIMLSACWTGQRVPLSNALFEEYAHWQAGAFKYPGAARLEAGATVDNFLEWYEGVTREQVLDILKHAQGSLTPPRKPGCGFFRPGRSSTSAAVIFRTRGHNGLAERMVGAVEGELLAAADADGFELLVTTDQNLRYQQNLRARRFAVLVSAHGSQLASFTAAPGSHCGHRLKLSMTWKTIPFGRNLGKVGSRSECAA
jgi:hypothetical protein